MASRGKQRNEVKAALAALQDEIKEAKKKGRLRRVSWRRLFWRENQSLRLKSYWSLRQRTSLVYKERRKSYWKRRIYSHAPTLPVTKKHRKFHQCRKIDNLIARSKKYLLRTHKWGCVTVISRRRAITFAHNEHRFLKSEIEINQMKDNLRANGRADSDIDLEIQTFVSNIKLYSTEKPIVESESDIVSKYSNSR